jgi:hypothetical protein
MSAARNLPFVAPQPINIDSTFTPTPQGVMIAVGQQVNFTVSAGVQVSSIQFAPNPANTTAPFVNITTFPNQQTPHAPASVNYFIYDSNGFQHGPYSIQVGNGVPLVVSITDDGVITYTPPVAAVPQRGSLLMMGDDDYAVNWGTNGDPVTPALNIIYSGGMQNNAIHTGAKPPNTYSYTVPPNGRKLQAGSKEKREGDLDVDVTEGNLEIEVKERIGDRPFTGPGGKIVIQN